MRASVRIAWRVSAAVAFGATAALAVTLTRGAPLHAALTSARHPTATAARHPRGMPACAASGLDISIATPSAAVSDARGATAHSLPRFTRFPVEFTNISGAPCTLSGYPEVSAYRADGAPVGNAAGLDTSVSARLIVLAPGATAHAAIVDSVSPGSCRPVAAAGLRITAPGQSVARYIRYELSACSAAGRQALVFLHVRAIQYGTGIPRAARHHRQSQSRLT